LNLFWKNVTTKLRWPSWFKAPVAGRWSLVEMEEGAAWKATYLGA